MSGHEDCHQQARDAWTRAEQKTGGEPIEVTISTAPPIIPGPLTRAITCPHGVTYWIEPTGDQVAKWLGGGAA